MIHTKERFTLRLVDEFRRCYITSIKLYSSNIKTYTHIYNMLRKPCQTREGIISYRDSTIFIQSYSDNK